MMIHKYKLKMTVDGTEYLADVNFNNALDTVFNKRKKRIRDYGNNIMPSNSGTLSGYMTYGVGITNDNEIPMIPMDTNFSWKGYRNTNYTDITGPINKVTLMCERIVRDSDKTFYTENLGTLFNNNICGQNIGNKFGEDNYTVIGLAEDGETMYGISFKSGNLKTAKFVMNDMRWGLDGLEGGSAYDRGQKFQYDIRINTGATIPANEINHAYTYNFDAVAELFDKDEQKETVIIDGQSIDYYTWNCFLSCQNDYYGTSEGTTITQDDNYIYMFEYLLGAVIRLGQYDPNYAYRPSNCDYYYNKSTRQIEGLGDVVFQPLLNYAVVDKRTGEVVQKQSLYLDNTVTIDMSVLSYTGSTPSSRHEIILLNETAMAPSIVNTAKYPFRMFAKCADNNYIYFVGGYSGTTTTFWKLDSSLINGEVLPQNLELVEVQTDNINNFCHTINRKNLFKTAALWGPYSYSLVDDIGFLVNKSNGIVNWIGFIDWMVSAEADFDNVQVNAGQTVKFELIEVIENEV